jgi:lipopolysaccharide export system ATP-binding protein
LGLAPIQDRKAYLLSGGERRRLEIARSLILTPDFLLLDEPFAGIDPMQIIELQELIKAFKNRGMGIIITDHNVREILKITDRSYIIHCGQVIFEGLSEELIADERVKKEYLGEEFRWN